MSFISKKLIFVSSVDDHLWFSKGPKDIYSILKSFQED